MLNALTATPQSAPRSTTWRHASGSPSCSGSSTPVPLASARPSCSAPSPEIPGAFGDGGLAAPFRNLVAALTDAVRNLAAALRGAVTDGGIAPPGRGSEPLPASGSTTFAPRTLSDSAPVEGPGTEDSATPFFTGDRAETIESTVSGLYEGALDYLGRDSWAGRALETVGGWVGSAWNAVSAWF